MNEESPITELLARWREGDDVALERLTPFVYGELRNIAAAIFYRERPGHTLQPTAVVHEAFVRLAEADVETLLVSPGQLMGKHRFKHFYGHISKNVNGKLFGFRFI